jgi:hypothetical protein
MQSMNMYFEKFDAQHKYFDHTQDLDFDCQVMKYVKGKKTFQN